VTLAGQNSGIKYDRQLQQLNMQNQARTNATKAQNLTVQAIPPPPWQFERLFFSAL